MLEIFLLKDKLRSMLQITLLSNISHKNLFVKRAPENQTGDAPYWN
jgi:hypothetical protein